MSCSVLNCHVSCNVRCGMSFDLSCNVLSCNVLSCHVNCYVSCNVRCDVS